MKKYFFLFLFTTLSALVLSQNNSVKGKIIKNFGETFNVENPNSQLIKELSNAGVDVITCGQTAMLRKIDKSVVLPEVKFALSAITTLLQYQNNGYKFIKF